MIEPKILPLVNAINNLGIVKTFSSCEGHYNKEEQRMMNRNKADVRFNALDNISLDTVEHFIVYLMTEFNFQHSFGPITLTGYKLYLPTTHPEKKYEVDYTFIVKIEPFDRFDESGTKRKETDVAILQATKLVNQYKHKFL